MTNQVIPEAAVEAALTVLRRGDLWELSDEEEARLILEAAAPHMLAEALEGAADAADDPSAEDMGDYFIDQADVGRWLRSRAATLRPTP